MGSKVSRKKAAPVRYASDELKRRDAAADEAFADEFIARNREALNEAVKSARASLKAGRGKLYHSPDELTADIMKSIRSTRKG